MSADPKCSGTAQYQPANLERLRLTALNRVFAVMAPLGTIVVTAASIHEAHEGRLFTIGVYTFLLALVLGAAFVKRVGYTIRASALLAALYLVALSELWWFGVASTADMVLLMFVLFAGVFFSLRTGVLAFCLSLGTILFVASVYVSGAMPIVRDPQDSSQHLMGWANGTLLFSFLAMGGLAMLSILLRKLEQSIEASRGLVDDLREEVAERRTAEQAARESEAVLRQVIDLVPHSIYAKDRASRFILVNRRSAELMGTTPQEAVGKTQAELTPREEEARALVDEDLEVITSGRPIYGKERTWTAPDGRTYAEDISKIPFSSSLSKGTAVLGISVDITERKRAEAERERLMSAIEQAAEAVLITDAEATIRYANPAFERITGYTRDEAIGQNPRILKSGEHDNVFYKRMWDTLTRGETWSGQFINKKKDGTLFTEEATISPVRDASGKTTNYVAVKRDITQEIKLEGQLRQAQKMEAVGQLAGGVAHDFNNLLQAILGYGDLALDEAGADSPVRASVEEILKAGKRAKTLVRQLLAFSRRQVLKMKDVDLNDVIANLMKMIRRVIGEHITLDTVAGHDLGIVRADPGQIEQILMNLCVNARDAMPDGGTITIETENVRIDEAFCETHSWAEPGRYALLSVTDTGCGMDEKTLRSVFEPFFTTKGLGTGTGLGLSTVYGLVKQHGGMVHVYSEVGKGTTFKVYLPLIERSAAIVGDRIKAPVPGGTETILLAEDDDMVRKLTTTILRHGGYTVLAASDGEEALRVFEDHADEINLVLLDVVMPKLGGRAVCERIRHVRPDLRFLFTSGYSMNAIHTNFVLDEGLQLIQKPCQRDDLLRKVRDVLDKGRDSPSP